MSEYIKREDAIKELNQLWFNMCGQEYHEGVDDAERVIKAVPSADVVEVVRCPDCINCHKISITAQPVSIRGTMRCNLRGGVVKENGYCSYGERKGGDKE